MLLGRKGKLGAGERQEIPESSHWTCERDQWLRGEFITVLTNESAHITPWFLRSYQQLRSLELTLSTIENYRLFPTGFLLI